MNLKKGKFTKWIALGLAVVIVGGVTLSPKSAVDSKALDVKKNDDNEQIMYMMENAVTEVNKDGTLEVTVTNEDGSKSTAIKSEEKLVVLEYDCDGNKIDEKEHDITKYTAIETATTDNNDEVVDSENQEKDSIEEAVSYNAEENTYEVVDESNLTEEEKEIVKEQTEYVNLQEDAEKINEMVEQESAQVGELSLDSRPELKWYGVYWKMTDTQVKVAAAIVKESSSLTGAVAGIMAIIPGTQGAATMAGCIAGAMYLSAGALTHMNEITGNKGLVVRFYYNLTLTVTPR